MNRAIALNVNYLGKSYLDITREEKQFLLEAEELHQRAWKL
jgi:hypothetical protein